MSVTQNDMRYRARCTKCYGVIGDWALHVTLDKRICWNCREHKVEDINKSYGSKASTLGAK